MINKVRTWFNRLLRELLTVRQPPSEVAFSFAMGVFLGILPFTGVAAAIALAWAFRLNKAAAILGSAITNTWMGLIVLGLSIKAAVDLLGLNGDQIRSQLHELFTDFHWHSLIDSSFVQLLGPVALAFVVISFLFAILAYCLAFAMIYWHRTHTNIQ